MKQSIKAHRSSGFLFFLAPNLRRYFWVGGAIGLYFGWFFRPVREPSILIVVGLSFLIALGLAVLSYFRREGSILTQFGRNMGKYMIILAVLECRHFAHDLGGRLAVVLMSVTMGMIIGVWLGWSETAGQKNKR
ncbi:MAG: hypothetical protein QNJ45_01970 [Ardenticatenaceae bacterium]|nr:hypothetical protein [Ardenticatenaceae bacterium]